MNKLAQYLNQHLVGEVLTDKQTLSRFSTDNGPLKIKPEMVAFPRTANDIRKLTRFAWQLAEKGHQLPVTPRGYGTSFTAGAVGSGVVISLSSHMNTIFEYDGKQRLVRLQPGVSVNALQNSLKLQGSTIASFEFVEGEATVGGVLANATADSVRATVDQMEVVLANGDVLQTKRLSKRELGKVKGKQGFEADIYRAVDGLIEESKELIAQLDTASAAGYSSLQHVKQKDGSLDLAPLFLGSQGTLGVISEMILKTDFNGSSQRVVIGAFADPAKARDAIDDVTKINPNYLAYYDQEMIARAATSGKAFSFLGEDKAPATVLVAIMSDAAARTQAKKAKKIAKTFAKYDAVVSQADDLATSEFANIVSIASLAEQDDSASSAIPVADSAHVPLARFEDFQSGVFELAKKHHVDLALHGKPLEGLWTIRPLLNLKTVGGKQAVFKLIDDYSQLITRCGGHLAGAYGEGRLQTFSAHKTIDEEVKKLYEQLKSIFDPHGILNTGVKQSGDLKELVSALRSEFSSQNSDALPRS